jgi:acyl-coenzyme A synthetase/AMP-(fatty) acid ligase
MLVIPWQEKRYTKIHIEKISKSNIYYLNDYAFSKDGYFWLLGRDDMQRVSDHRFVL